MYEDAGNELFWKTNANTWRYSAQALKTLDLMCIFGSLQLEGNQLYREG